MGAQEWIDAIRSIQRIRNNDQGDALISLLLATPDEVFTDSSFHDQPLALTCFLDAGIRLYQQALPDSAEQAFAGLASCKPSCSCASARPILPGGFAIGV